MKFEEMINQIITADSLEIMKLIPDKAVDLVLTDPPYGLNTKMQGGSHGITINENREMLEWDNLISSNYWNEIFRTSKNQIIWGGQYYSFRPSRCWLVWKKPYFPTMSDAELAWTSFDKNVKVYEESRNPEGFKEHPTQKPISLMKWCLLNYSKEGDLVADFFGGSGTTAVACKDMKRNFIVCEKETKYVAIAKERLRILDMNPKLL